MTVLDGVMAVGYESPPSLLSDTRDFMTWGEWVEGSRTCKLTVDKCFKLYHCIHMSEKCSR